MFIDFKCRDLNTLKGREIEMLMAQFFALTMEPLRGDASLCASFINCHVVVLRDYYRKLY